MENADRDMKKALAIWDTHKTKLTPFIGPVLSGAPTRQWLARQLPETATAGTEFAMPKELVAIKTVLAQALNLFLRAQSGQAVTDPEFKRMMAEFPDFTENPSVFDQKLRMTEKNHAIVLERMQEMSAVGGRERVNPAAVIMRHPMPEPQDVKPVVPFKRKKERDGSITIVPGRE